jgi:hypothetical protein
MNVGTPGRTAAQREERYESAAREADGNRPDTYLLLADAAIVTQAGNDASPAAESCIQTVSGTAGAMCAGADSGADLCDDHGGSRSSQAQRSASRPALITSSSSVASAPSVPPPTWMQNRRLGSGTPTPDTASKTRCGRARGGRCAGEPNRGRWASAVGTRGCDDGADEGEQEESPGPAAGQARWATTRLARPRGDARRPTRRADADPASVALRLCA